MPLVLAGSLLTIWSAMLLFGTGDLDRSLLFALNLGEESFLTSGAVAITTLGGWPFLLTLTAGATIALAVHGRTAAAILLAGSTMIGRLLIELQKWTFERPRPEEQLRFIELDSHAFPSGHAANSMITFVILALLFSEGRTRRRLIALAIALSLVVGVTRILLGVHWPSDVVAGWAFGVLWIFVVIEAGRRIPRASV